MASVMGVQKYATERNSQAEFLIDFVLQQFVVRLKKEDLIVNEPTTTLQKKFQRDDCSDVFDHFLELELNESKCGTSEKIEIWAQTTCYKGNKTGKPEPNKTYEIRETIIESLGLRRWLLEERVAFRTVHFTVGSEKYTYDWFKGVKENAFDLSIYPNTSFNMEDVFNELATVFIGVELEIECFERLEEIFHNKSTPLGFFMNETLDSLYRWFKDGLPIKEQANKQAILMNELRSIQQEALKYALNESKKPGADIKINAIKLLNGEEVEDIVMSKTLKRLTSSNPFLELAFEALADWDKWSMDTFQIPIGCNDLKEYIYYLWDTKDVRKLVIRRLLLRIHTNKAIFYIQDRNIEGITEHNLYNGQHVDYIIEKVVSSIYQDCIDAEIISPEQLYSELIGKKGKRLLRDSLKFEKSNGTNLKPSFYYVEEALSDKYQFVNFKQTDLPGPIAYYCHYDKNSKVRPYANLKVIVEKDTGKPLAIIKAKFFNKPEFPRRAKEESYVGLTLKYDLVKDKFIDNYPGIPLIMFVDMAENCNPPEYAVTRLVTAGWNLVFSIDEMKKILERLSNKESMFIGK